MATWSLRIFAGFRPSLLHSLLHSLRAYQRKGTGKKSVRRAGRLVLPAADAAAAATCVFLPRQFRTYGRAMDRGLS
ncbi:hypothetical protein GGTG_09363 [Gaeumannomyces tritici R3-111a-1]|uniref:Uncharacterized protein n=1 Tax=Gaeumannomyces tritici (strain R3-111a-1) TaxID=644352 RepID=J3P766_GAET3|nr:hypothetical protein GGTG_09363 [Gaeumannomyces tritici R3-111a-1]EJT72497.1 hypothetical protein GGTG_09363 [Gaeumannomyces tritici R3-111a-1]